MPWISPFTSAWFRVAAAVVAPLSAPVSTPLDAHHMNAATTRRKRAWCVAILLISLSSTARFASAQPGDQADAAETRSQPPVVQKLDVEALLDDEAVLKQDIDDVIWDYSQPDKRRLVQIPVRIERVREATTLNKPVVDVRLGRFVAWRIPEPEEDRAKEDPRNQRPSRREERVLQMGDREALAELSGGEQRVKDDDPARQAIRAAGDAVSEVDRLLGEAEEDIPRVARSIEVRPDGTVAYPVERAIPGAEVSQGDTLYHLYLRRDRLQEKAPSRDSLPERKQNEDIREFRQRQLEARQQLLADMKAFRDLRKAVSALPDEVVVPRPQVVLCLFEMPEVIYELGLTGGFDSSAGAWTVPFDLLEELRTMKEYRGAGRRDVLSEEDRELALRLLEWTSDEHPLSLRATAYAVRASGWVSVAEVDGPVYKLLSRIIEGRDSVARKEALAALVGLVPPTQASARLLRDSASQLTPELRMVSLRNLFSMDPRQQGGSEDLVETANDVLKDPKSPPASEVVLEIVRTAEGNDRAAAALMEGVDFAELPADRREQAIHAVVRLGGRFELARRWINDRLLRSDDASVVRGTLERLVELKLEEADEDDRRFQRDPRRWRRGDEVEQPLAEGQASPAIPIYSSRHALFDLMESRDERTRSLAFDALRSFVFGPVDRAPGEAQRTDPRYRRLVEVALDLKPVPTEPARFLGQQGQREDVAVALTRIVLEAGEPAAGVAAAELLALEQDMTRMLSEMGSDDRRKLVSRLYLEAQGRVSPIVGLLEARGATRDLLPWVGRQIGAGELPAEREWVRVYGDERRLVELVAEEEPVVARAAAAGLIATASGPMDEVDDLVRRLSPLDPDDSDKLREAWKQFRTEMMKRVLQEAAGDYRVELDVSRAGESETFKLGQLTLLASESGLSVANDAFPLEPGSESLSLQIRPVELKNLPNEALDDLPLGQSVGPLVLSPGQDGEWSGETMLRNGQRVTLRLTPVEE